MLRGQTLPERNRIGPMKMVFAPIFILAYLGTMLILFLYASKVVFEPTLLLPVMNTIFAGMLPIGVAIIGMRAYFFGGRNSILLMSCGLMIFGSGAILAGWLMGGSQGINVNVTIYNVCALLGAISHVMGVVFIVNKESPETSIERKRANLTLICSGIFVFLLCITWATLLGVTPLFFVQETGPTLLRQFVLGVSASLYFLSALFLTILFKREQKPFYYWYAMALVTICLGLVAAIIQPSVGSPMGWLNRVGHYVAGIFAMVAILATSSEARRKGVPFRLEMTELFRQAQMSYEVLVETVSEPIITTDQNFRIMQWNSAAERKFGYSHNYALGQSLLDLVIAPSSTENFKSTANEILQAYVGRQAVGNQIEVTGKSKAVGDLSLEVSLSGMLVMGQRLLVLVFRDSTKRIAVEEALREQLVLLRTAELSAAKADAVKANDAKTRFLAAVSHDLRQPLSALSLYVGVLKRQVSPDCASLVENIDVCAQSLNGLLTDLLDVSKLEAGVVKANLSNFSINDLLARLVSIYSVEAQIKDLRLRFHAPRSDIHINTDRELLQRILGNLISNAIRYTNKGGVLIAYRCHQGKQWIEVWDTGIGIADDKMGIIFEEFKQIDNETRSHGSGLGLAIVSKTAALLGLQIRVLSRLHVRN